MNAWHCRRWCSSSMFGLRTCCDFLVPLAKCNCAVRPTNDGNICSVEECPPHFVARSSCNSSSGKVTISGNIDKVPTHAVDDIIHGCRRSPFPGSPCSPFCDRPLSAFAPELRPMRRGFANHCKDKMTFRTSGLCSPETPDVLFALGVRCF